MADTTTVDTYDKAEYQQTDVEKFQADKLADGAKSCVLSDGGDNWVLTTVWPGDG